MKIYYWAMSDCPSAQIGDWEVIKKVLPGVEVVSEIDEADFVIAHFCALTKDEILRAKNELIGLIKKKKQHPAMKLIVGGCLLEIKNGKQYYPDVFELLDSTEIDLKFGRETMAEVILGYFGLSYEQRMTIAHIEGNAVCIQIASGCNRRCSFCKCHYLHMPYRSVPIDEVRCEIERAIGEGVTRLNITGENITEYGSDTNGNLELIGLLKGIIHDYPEIKVIDLCGVTLDEIDKRLLWFLVREPKIGMIQVEAQSFIPEVRKAMNLKKTAEEAMRIIAELASKKPIISNIMIGHPEENEKGFKRQYAFIRQKGLFMLEPNIYINTVGTKSSLMWQIPEKLAKKRFGEMLQLTYELRKAYVASVCARRVTARVLVSKPDGLVLMPVNKPVIIEVEQNGLVGLVVGDLVECVVDGLLYSENSPQKGPSFIGEMASLINPHDNRIHLRGHLV